MNWYYALGGQQHGPIDDAQLDSLVAAGTIRPETLVWREGMANWQPFREARPAPGQPPVPGAVPPLAAGVGPGSSSTPGAGSGQVQCSECGRLFAPQDVIAYGTAWVCAGCKPIFLQRIREGAAPMASFGVVNEDQLLAREYRIEIGACLSRAWNLFTQNAGIVIGVSLLIAVIYFGVAMVTGVLGVAAQEISPRTARFVMPFVNQLWFAVVSGPIAGGYFWFLLRLARGEQAGISDALSGFSRRAGQLVLCAFAQGMSQIVCMAPLLLSMAAAGIGSLWRRGGPVSMPPGFLPGFFGALLVAIVGMTYFSTVWTHSYFLIMDKDYRFTKALSLSMRLVHKRWWMTWAFLLVSGIIAGLGAILCCVGMLATFPIYLAMRAWLYEDNFRDLARATPGP
jgi:uncharacterized membrane protein